jgi:hypothetical protein
MSQIVQKFDEGNVEVISLARHQRIIGEMQFIYESVSLQVSKTMMQGWIRKKTNTGNAAGVDLYPVRYFQLRRDTGELKILKDTDSTSKT